MRRAGAGSGAVRDRFRRRRWNQGDQDRRGPDLRSGRQRRIQQHAEQRHRHRERGLRVAARRNRPGAGPDRAASAAARDGRRRDRSAPDHGVAGAVERDRLRQLQADHHRPARAAADRRQPAARPAGIRRAGRAERRGGTGVARRRAHPRHHVLSRSPGLRGARGAGLSQDSRASGAGRRHPGLGAGLLDGRGGLLARDLSARADRRHASGRCPDQAVRNRRQLRRHRRRPRRKIPAGYRTARVCRAPGALFPEDRSGPSDQQAGPRPVCLRPARRHPRSPLRRHGSHKLPQPAHLPGHRRCRTGCCLSSTMRSRTPGFSSSGPPRRSVRFPDSWRSTPGTGSTPARRRRPGSPSTSPIGGSPPPWTRRPDR